MFNEIAKSYDKLNHILSFGLDKLWRKKFVKLLKKNHYGTIADVASGTGDLLINLQSLNADKYYIIDPSEEMLAIADTKICQAEKIIAHAEALPLPDECVDLITVSFGIRNFNDVERSLSEFYRVLKNNGTLSIMEFSMPGFFLFRWIFLLYLKILVPVIGKIVSKNNSAYYYLKDSIIEFSSNVNIPELLKSEKFKKTSRKILCLGVVNIYTCHKQ